MAMSMMEDVSLLAYYLGESVMKKLRKEGSRMGREREKREGGREGQSRKLGGIWNCGKTETVPSKGRMWFYLQQVRSPSFLAVQGSIGELTLHLCLNHLIQDKYCHL